MTATVAKTADQPCKDNILGICNAVGRDFGFNPVFLRLGFAIALLANSKAALIAYLGLGLVVLASRLLVRPRRAESMAAPVSQGWVPAIPAARAEGAAIDTHALA